MLNIIHAKAHIQQLLLVGLWETWIAGGGLFFTVGYFNFIPYLVLQSIYIVYGSKFNYTLQFGQYVNYYNGIHYIIQ